jgi:hypothetical protein
MLTEYCYMVVRQKKKNILALKGLVRILYTKKSHNFVPSTSWMEMCDTLH